jgi:hypothetical protein
VADRRFTLEEALEMLRKEAEYRHEGLAREAAELEDHLRLAFAAREPNLAAAAATSADVLHVFDCDVPWPVPAGNRLELGSGGERWGYSLVAPPLEKGRYRVVLALTKMPDEPTR